MTIPVSDSAIRLRGVRHNNLKNFDLDIPIGKLTVITGLSGSGKSSLAFDTLFAEGQRRYIETFSPYARQFFDRMDKPQVDRIDGIPPAIAIEQRNSVRSTRSTVGTMTELCDYMKLLWPHLAQLHCRQCGQLVRAEPPQVVWESAVAEAASLVSFASSARSSTATGTATCEALVTFDLMLSEKLSVADSLGLIAKQGYQRLLLEGEIIRLEEAAARLVPGVARLTIVQDRLSLTPSGRARFIEACEQAYHFGKGRLTVHFPAVATRHAKLDIRGSKAFSSGFHCAACDLDYPEPTPALFSFNHPIGACPACKGFGRIISIDYDLALPDRSRTIAAGVVKPWQTGMSADCQADLVKFCRKSRIPMDVPFAELSAEHQRWVIEGDPGYDPNDPEHSWPRAWYGVKGYFRWLESKSYKMHVRVLLSRYRAYTTCPQCAGKRLKPEALLYTLAHPTKEVISRSVAGVQSRSAARPITGSLNTDPLVTEYSLPDFYALSIDNALAFTEGLAAHHTPQPNDPLALALGEVRARLRYLVEAGLGYLTLDRPTRTLSGGETERVNLTTCLGTRLVNTLFVLDEPSVGLHPRDTARLVRILEQLRDTGNTVVVVEHEASVMRAADQVVDLGPGQGEKGGEVVFCGAVNELLASEHSLTGRYLSGRKQVEIPARRPVHLAAAGASRHDSLPASLELNETAVPYGARTGKGEAIRESVISEQPSGQVPPVTARLNTDSLMAVRCLRLTNASRHNLKNLSVEIPLGRFVALTGVSGSGKTTLVREVLLPALQARLKTDPAAAKASDRMDLEADDGREEYSIASSRFSLSGWESLSQVVLVDQSPLGKTPRSNPVVYLGAFDDVRELFAQAELAKQRGLNGSAFSFNSGVGQCERCRGAGFEKIEMQFLSDIFIRCPECNGRRYREHILEVKLRGPVQRRSEISGSEAGNQSTNRAAASGSATDSPDTGSMMAEWSIADLLEATVDDALTFLMNFIHVPAGRRAFACLRLLQEVGLGYLRLGQPINTLSGGESQRLKLVSHLAESAAASDPAPGEPARLTARNTIAEVKDWLVKRQSGKPTGTSALTPTLSSRERGRHLVTEDSSASLRSQPSLNRGDRAGTIGSGQRALSWGEGWGEGEPIPRQHFHPPRPPSAPSSFSTNPPPACTSTTCACCFKFSNASWMPATASWSSSTISTSSSALIG